MLMPSPEEFDALTRLDFNMFVERTFVELNGSTPYLDNFHIGVICSELEAVRAGGQRRLAIAVPPRSLKSVIVSVAFPAWLLGHNPEAKIICASYGQQLADDLARDCRQIMRSDWYRRLFPATRLASDRQAIGNFETSAGGFRHATSVGGALTGLGADIIIVDDPTKPEEVFSDVERARANAWARHTLFTRLNDKGRGSIILVMQRLHENDLIGHVSEFTDMKHLAFSAIAQENESYTFHTPFGVRRHLRQEGEELHREREPIEVLEEIRTAIGTRFFSAQYLQMPGPPGGSIVKPEWFSRYSLIDLPKFDRIVQSWDTASKASQLSDYSVCTTWGKKDRNIFLLHVLRKRLDYPDLKRAVRDNARAHGANTILIEDCASGIQLIQELRAENVSGLQAVKPKGDKIMRMTGQTAIIESGTVFLPISAPWLEDYLHELMMFPAGKHDDQVDSTSQALANLTSLTGAEAWIEYYRSLVEERDNPPMNIRLNHPDKGMRFHLFGGRVAVRDEDGSFLVTAEECRYAMQIEGIQRVS